MIYRAYGNNTLNIFGDFPLSITLGPGYYSFALFGVKDKDIDERPFLSKLVVVESSSPPTFGK